MKSLNSLILLTNSFSFFVAYEGDVYGLEESDSDDEYDPDGDSDDEQSGKILNYSIQIIIVLFYFCF